MKFKMRPPIDDMDEDDMDTPESPKRGKGKKALSSILLIRMEGQMKKKGKGKGMKGKGMKPGCCPEGM